MSHLLSEKKYNQITLLQDPHPPFLLQILIKKNTNPKYHLLIIADRIVLLELTILQKSKLSISEAKLLNTLKGSVKIRLSVRMLLSVVKKTN